MTKGFACVCKLGLHVFSVHSFCVNELTTARTSFAISSKLKLSSKLAHGRGSPRTAPHDTFSTDRFAFAEHRGAAIVAHHHPKLGGRRGALQGCRQRRKPTLAVGLGCHCHWRAARRGVAAAAAAASPRGACGPLARSQATPVGPQ